MPHVDDRFYMGLVLDLAHQGRFLVSPNPRVGCVIVRPATPPATPSRIIGQGFHQRCGEPHAERNALSDCDEDPRGATLYVNLEPCCHHGRTPPCTDAILEAGIARVVIANSDPFPAVQGHGVEILRSAGIQVETGVLAEEGWAENRFFFTRHEQQRPWMILKAAVSLDGKCATRTGDSKWITGETARAHVHESRAEMDAVLAGIGTVLADKPALTARPQSLSAEAFRQPVRVILDPEALTPPDASLLDPCHDSPVWILHSPHASEKNCHQLGAAGATMIEIPGDATGLDLEAVVRELASHDLLSVWIEGGPKMHSAFLNAGLVDEVRLYVAPKIIGNVEAPSFAMTEGVATMDDALVLHRLQRHFLGDDTLIEGWLSRKGAEQ